MCVFFGKVSFWSNVRPLWRDRKIYWPTDKTNTVIKQRGQFISFLLWNAPRREAKTALLTDSTVKCHFVAQFGQLDIWLHKQQMNLELNNAKTFQQ